MSFTANPLNNKELSTLAQRAGTVVTSAIERASSSTGVDFAYLMQQANVESSFDTDAKARGSSATGLFQFIDKTWLSMVNKYGDKYGLGNLASKIDDSGKVQSRAAKQQILSLRNDPAIASLMAAEYAAENKSTLEQSLGQRVGATDMYLAHFMGAGGASAFLKAMNDAPSTPGATLFPQAAKANKAIFYDKQTGAPKTLAQIYEHFDRKFDVASSGETPKLYQDMYPQDYSTKGPRQTASASMFIEETKEWVEIKPRLGVFAPGSKVAAASGRHQVLNPLDVMELAQTDDRHTARRSRYNA